MPKAIPDPSKAKDGERVVFMGAQGDGANGSAGRLRMVIEWEDGLGTDSFNEYIVDQYNEVTHTWIVNR